MTTKRCSCCASEHEPYNGEASPDTCIEFETFHADRGSERFTICHTCSTTINAAWAKLHGVARACLPVVACRLCGEPTTALLCEGCTQMDQA